MKIVCFLGLGVLLLANYSPAAESPASLIEKFLFPPSKEATDPIEREYRSLLRDDDNAHTEVDDWIQEAQEGGRDIASLTLRARVHERLEPVRAGYQKFIEKHPDHARARLAFGSFLHDLQDDEAARAQWEKARDLNPKNPATWNNLANLYGHSGLVSNAFVCYAKAIELNSNEPVYFHNYADTVFLFRRDATNFFHFTETQVFAKAMDLYHEAQRLDPENFLLATDIAQTYYGIRSAKTGDTNEDRIAFLKLSDEALASWKIAEKLARDDLEREGVQIHFARWQINSGRFDEARARLGAVTNSMFASSKKNLLRKLASVAENPSATPPLDPNSPEH